MKTALAVLLALTPVSAFASEYQQGYSASRTCFKTEYRAVSYTHLTLPTSDLV